MTDSDMALFPQQFIDDLRLQANIVQVVQEYVPLKRAGTTYKGLCPFHSEKTPSFHVDPEKGFFHCFGCGVGGDVFKFLELHEKVGFRTPCGCSRRSSACRCPSRAKAAATTRGGMPGCARRCSRCTRWRRRISASSSPARPGARARQQLAERGVHAADDRAARPGLRAARRATA